MESSGNGGREERQHATGVLLPGWDWTRKLEMEDRKNSQNHFPDSQAIGCPERERVPWDLPVSKE